MTDLRVAFLGPLGTFCEQALRRIPDADLAAALGGTDAPVLVPAVSTTSALDAVRRGEVDAACVPIENSTEGAVPAAMDGLVETPPLVIVREMLLPVRFDVLVRAGTTVEDVASVASHPHGEAQTRRWLAAHLPAAEVRLTSSTAAAAAQVAAGEVDAAVCAPIAAEHHGLVPLATGIHDTGDAVTRFVLVRPPSESLGVPVPTGADRTSLAATTLNRPGTLLAVLTEIAVRGVDLTRIESRPLKDRRGEYWFFLDGTGHVADAAMGEALAALRRRCTDVRFLGSYPQAVAPEAPVETGRGPEPVAESEGLGVGQGEKDYAAATAWLAALRAGSGVREPVGGDEDAGELRLILARHGQTRANVDHLLDTRLPGPGLTALGREQAAALARELAAGDEGVVDAVYHSRARRAGETARIVGAELGLAPLAVDGVHEVQVGDLEGLGDDRSIAVFRSVFDAWQLGELDRAHPGGESGRDLLKRYLSAVEQLVERHRAGGTVVLVSHGAALRLAAEVLVDGVGTPGPEEDHVNNAGRVVLRRRTGEPGPWVLEAWRNDVPGGLPSSRDATG